MPPRCHWLAVAERGRLYRWPCNRSFGDSKQRPVVVIAPEAATRHSRRWVVLPLSSDGRLAGQRMAYRLDPSASNGLEQISFVMTWLPTMVAADQLDGPLGRLQQEQLREILSLLSEALDLSVQEPWQQEP